jgi:hypothetical protein
VNFRFACLILRMTVYQVWPDLVDGAEPGVHEIPRRRQHRNRALKLLVKQKCRFRAMSPLIPG